MRDADKWPRHRVPRQYSPPPVAPQLQPPSADVADDFEVLLFGGDAPELTLARAEHNTELMSALALAARTCGVVPTALQLPAAPPARASSGHDPIEDDEPPFDSAYCLRLSLRTRPQHPRGRTDFLNAVLRLATLYRLGLHVGESPRAASASGGSDSDGSDSGTVPASPMRYRRVLALPSQSRGDRGARRPRHRVIDLTVAEPVPPRSPLDGSLMVTVVGPLRRELADDLVGIATFLDDHRVGCHAATSTVLVTEGTVVLNLVLVVLPGAPVGTAAFTDILRRGLPSDPVWPRAYRPTLLDPVATRS